MKKIALVVLAIALCTSMAFADIQVQSNGSNIGIATKLNIVGGTVTRSGQTATVTVTNGGTTQTALSQTGGTSQMVSGSTAVPVTVTVVKKYIGSSQAGTLANGTKGQVLKVIVSTNDAAYTFTVTPTTKSGFTSFALSTVGNFVTLMYVDDTVGWIVIGYYGATVNP